MGIKIICDSTAYIPEKLIKEYAISVIPLSVIFETESFKETEIDNETFHKKMEKSPNIPTSSQPSIDELYNMFENFINEGNSIVGIFMSSELSGTFSSVNLVKNMILENYPDAKIEVIDSRITCMPMGFAVIEAAKAAQQGKKIEEVTCEVYKILNNCRILFIPDSLTYLKKGGRIGGAEALLGTILQVKPILTVEEGKATVFDKVRTKKRAVARMIEKFIGDVNEKELRGVAVQHINSVDEAIELANNIKEKLGVQVEICDISPVIGVHVGPKAIGISYYTNP